MKPLPSLHTRSSTASQRTKSAQTSPSRLSTASSSASSPSKNRGNLIGSLKRPSLLAGLPPFSFDGPLFDLTSSFSAGVDATKATAPRRTNWNIRDVSLPPVPPLCPPLDSKSVVCIADASPSVVATRISECLRKRSVGVEYDDEAASAYALTSDNVRFTINLYRGGKAGSLLSNSPPIYSEQKGLRPQSKVEHDTNSLSKIKPDFSHVVIVECKRIRGDIITFHRCRVAILSAASGNSDGMDDFRKGKLRGTVGYSPFSFRGQINRQMTKEDDQNDEDCDEEASYLLRTPLSVQSTLAANQALERVLDLLLKDRVDAQLLGMESLVILTDARTSGVRTATSAALCVLGSQFEAEFGGKRSQLGEVIHKWIVSLVRYRRVPGEDVGVSNLSYEHSSTFEACDDEEATLRMAERLTGGPELSGEQRQSRGNITTSRRSPGGDVQHFGPMRGLALRALSNALVVASSEKRKGGNILLVALENFEDKNRSRREKQHAYLAKEFLAELAEDVAGASRPPSASSWEEAATCFGTAHDAALATKCLRLLVTHSDRARDIVMKDFVGGPGTHPLLTSVKRARKIGKASHAVLEKEADKFCLALRQCGIESV